MDGAAAAAPPPPSPREPRQGGRDQAGAPVKPVPRPAGPPAAGGGGGGGSPPRGRAYDKVGADSCRGILVEGVFRAADELQALARGATSYQEACHRLVGPSQACSLALRAARERQGDAAWRSRAELLQAGAAAQDAVACALGLVKQFGHSGRLQGVLHSAFHNRQIISKFEEVRARLESAGRDLWAGAGRAPLESGGWGGGGGGALQEGEEGEGTAEEEEEAEGPAFAPRELQADAPSAAAPPAAAAAEERRREQQQEAQQQDARAAAAEGDADAPRDAGTPAAAPPAARFAAGLSGEGSAGFGEEASAEQQLSPEWIVRYEDIDQRHNVGEGSFGCVSFGYWNGTEVAIKELKPPNLNSGSQEASETSWNRRMMAELAKEVKILSGLRHPHVVLFMGVTLSPPCIVTEYCARGSVYNVLFRARRDPALAAQITWMRRVEMALGAAKGMLHLHAHRSDVLLHRDLKSPNLLVGTDWRVRICDFNLSRYMSAERSYLQSRMTVNPRWCAPEALLEGRYSKKADVYSFGIVMWELLTWCAVQGREVPWEGCQDAQIFMALSKGGRPEREAPASPLPGQLPPDASEIDDYEGLMRACWDEDPEVRPDFAEVISRLRELQRRARRAAAAAVRGAAGAGGGGKEEGPRPPRVEAAVSETSVAPDRLSRALGGGGGGAARAPRPQQREQQPQQQQHARHEHAPPPLPAHPEGRPSAHPWAPTRAGSIRADAGAIAREAGSVSGQPGLRGGGRYMWPSITAPTPPPGLALSPSGPAASPFADLLWQAEADPFGAAAAAAAVSDRLTPVEQAAAQAAAEASLTPFGDAGFQASAEAAAGGLQLLLMS
ncbi:MAG: kinase-like domain-containing protein [Monoraphidium minutum]|nr:MAG: kinase-like domain-containing protein [Monoraphidium minutum]